MVLSQLKKPQLLRMTAGGPENVNKKGEITIIKKQSQRERERGSDRKRERNSPRIFHQVDISQVESWHLYRVIYQITRHSK